MFRIPENFFDRMSNCEMVDNQKVCRVTLTQSVICDRKNRCVLRGLIHKNHQVSITIKHN